MTHVEKTAIPLDSFMSAYKQIDGCSADAFRGYLEFPVTLEALITAFFGSPIFTLERLLLKSIGQANTSRSDITGLAAGTQEKFAAWKVEDRNESEVILKVGSSPIRSWLMARPDGDGKTAIYFGSAVLPQTTNRNSKPQVGSSFRFFMGVHNFYSCLLLKSTIKNLQKKQR